MAGVVGVGARSWASSTPAFQRQTSTRRTIRSVEQPNFFMRKLLSNRVPGIRGHQRENSRSGEKAERLLVSMNYRTTDGGGGQRWKEADKATGSRRNRR